ncbi:17543_t:CDS:2 [Entrophospora sp. SA101]|nr:17543_t:CDS:2 [Entrophospora sp. SA101]
MRTTEIKTLFFSDKKDFKFDFEDFVKNELGVGVQKPFPQREICQDYVRGVCHRGTSCRYEHIIKKFIVCKHWLRGLCMKGDEQCEYLHEYKLSRMPKCIYFNLFGVCQNANCIYSHIEKDHEICGDYECGFCKHGPDCLKKHVKKVLCESYFMGFCLKGPKCSDGHPKIDLRKLKNLTKSSNESVIKIGKRQQNCLYQYQQQQNSYQRHAGSSGSRIQIYSWKDHSIVRQGKDEKDLHVLPTVERADEHGVNWQLKVEPGISSFANEPTEVGPLHLKPLLQFADKVIPTNEIHQTPIYLLATAGMRLLLPSQQQAILQNACDYIQFNYRFKINKCSDHVQVITGETEGIYGWIAVNYLMNGFVNDDGKSLIADGKKNSDQTSTFGFLDMGGASTQIAFEPNKIEAKKHANDLTKVTLYTLDGNRLDYNVFVTTFLGFGTNEARRRYIESRIKKYTSTHEQIVNPDTAREQPTILLKDPCLPVDLLLTDRTLPPPYYTLQGTGDFNLCLKDTYELLNKYAPCLDNPCLFNGVHTPKIDFSVNKFIGISEYWYSSHDIYGLGGMWNFPEFEKKALDYCARNWENIVETYYLKGETANPSIDLTRLELQCFKSAWLVNILHEGIGVPRMIDSGGLPENNNLLEKVRHKSPFQSINSINNIAVSWTLGKMVLEASTSIISSQVLPPPPPPPSSYSRARGLFGHYNFMVEWIIGVTILLVILLMIWWLCLRSKNIIGKGIKISIAFLYSCIYSLFNRSGKGKEEPDYRRLESGSGGGQYSTLWEKILGMK